MFTSEDAGDILLGGFLPAASALKHRIWQANKDIRFKDFQDSFPKKEKLEIKNKTYKDNILKSISFVTQRVLTVVLLRLQTMEEIMNSRLFLREYKK